MRILFIFINSDLKQSGATGVVFSLIIYILTIMLGDQLNRPKQLELSKSSIMGQQADQKRLRQMIEERDRTIRKLSKKIDKLQATLKKSTLPKAISEYSRQASNEDNNYFQMLKAEVNKTKQLEDIIVNMTRRINSILEDLAHDNSFTDNSEELKHMLEQLELQNNVSVSSEYLDLEGNTSFSISQEWIKNIDILEGTIKSFKAKCLGYKQEAKALNIKLEETSKIIEQLSHKLKESDQIRQIRAELKEQRKQRQKLRGLLDRTEFQKNQLMNKINNIGLKDLEIRAKTKEQLLQYSKELNYRIKDLQKQKEDMLKENNKEKETEFRKYQDVLRKLRTIKQTSRLGKSFA